jgi:hypothetical protein
MCPSCSTTLAVREAPEKLQRLYRELWLSPLIMGLGVSIPITVFVSLENLVLGVVLGLLAGFPFFLLTLIIAVNRSATAGWVVFVLELLVSLFLLTSGGSVSIISILFGAVAATVALLTVLQILKIRELEALVSAHPVAWSGSAPRESGLR